MNHLEKYELFLEEQRLKIGKPYIYNGYGGWIRLKAGRTIETVPVFVVLENIVVL